MVIMGRLNSEIIRDVRDRSDIVEVVSEYVRLKPAGRNHVGLCPFHTERTPSFTVSREKGLFYCFGCGEGGDVFKFLMKIHNIPFFDAVRLLARRLGVDLAPPVSDAERKLYEERELLYRANELAMRFFEDILHRSTGGAEARSYLQKRGLNSDMARRFGLGYSLPAWDSLLKFLRAGGIPEEIQFRAGLVLRRKDASGYYDRFRGRIMFPIFDVTGRVIGFGGRVLDDSTPKYLNSPETALFSKGRTLYGLHLARDRIRASGSALIVEGYMDVIALHQYGFENAVASLGTAFTEEQARFLGGLAPSVTIAYDSDLAGDRATLRGMELLSALGLDVRIARLPPGADPDSFVRKEGREAFSRVLSESLPLLDYRIELALDRYDLRSLEGRVRAAGEVSRILAGLTNSVEREEYARAVARRLGISPESLLDDINRSARRMARQASLKRQREGREDNFGESAYNNSTQPSAPESVYASNAYMAAEAGLVRLMAEDIAVYEKVRDEVGIQGFVYPEHREIACVIDELARELANAGVRREGWKIQPSVILERLGDGRAAERALKIFMGPATEPGMDGDRARIACDYIKVMQEYQLRERIKALEGEIRALEAKGETVRSKEALAELGRLMSRLSREFSPFHGIGI